MTRRAVLAVVLAVSLGGCGQLGSDTRYAAGNDPVVSDAPVASPAPAAPPVRLGPRELPVSVAVGYAHRVAGRKAAFEVWRLAELAKARRSTTVAGALRRALLAREITRREHDRLRGDYAAARAALGRLSGLRRAELAAVVGHVDALAASHQLTTGRLTPVFLVLRRNRQFWTSTASFPAAHDRTTFGRDPAVFQYYPGQGMQLQQLASWGRVNARLGVCLRQRCAGRARLRRAVERLVGLSAPRAGFVAWEYYFSFAGGTPPWISGMTQGTAIQALARAARVFRSRAFRRDAVRALGAFRAPPPLGVSVPAPGGRHYLMYSFSPGLRILNGDLQAITGLRDLAVLGHSRGAQTLFARGERAARRAVGRFDTGAWSLYSQDGRESTLGYHQLVSQFLGNLCRRTDRRTYCAANRRFVRYEHEPPRIGIARLTGLRARRATTVRFSLSKLATVDVRVSGARGGVTLDRRLSLERGSHAVAWVPPARGHYRVQVVAQGPSGPRGVSDESVRVVLPKPRHHKKRARNIGSPNADSCCGSRGVRGAAGGAGRRARRAGSR
jgi:hypothetical protein